MSHCIIGIDNGLDGGLVTLDHRGGVFDYIVMPTITMSKRMIDVQRVVDYVNSRKEKLGQVFVALEEPLHAAGSSQSLRSMSISFGQIYGALSVLGFYVKPIEVGAWQNRMLPRGPKGTTKVRALKRASEEWPEENWIPVRCRTPHDGVVDAALIAKYYQINHLP